MLYERTPKICRFHTNDENSKMEESSAQRRRRKILYARKLRQRMTTAEKILWEHLRARRCAGLKFRRQAPVAWFIADFLCPQYGLIVEIDGSVHADQAMYDRERDEELRTMRYRVLRLTNDEVIHHLDICIARIIDACVSQSTPLRRRPGGSSMCRG